METDEQELRDAVIYTKYSLFITIVSLPFGLMGFILRESSSFAIDMFAYGILGFFIGLISLFIWYWKLKKLRRNLR